MGTLLQSDSRRLYSWWWDSHISPKSSKWLHENLADMDAKVNTMIKLIEEDADSFAIRAEMYYKRRPELMKLVEEFYRTYRALAERYDHATRELRQVHHVMARSYPNPVPFIPADDPASGSSINEGKPCTPERPHHVCALFDHEDFHKDALGLSTSHFHGSYFEDSDAVTRKKGLKQLNEMFGPVEGAPHTKFSEEKVRKCLKFQKVEEKEEISQDGVSHISTENQNLKIQLLPVSERSFKAESKVQTLEETDAKLEAKNEAGLSQNLQRLVLFSELETQESCVHGDSRRLNDQASNAETEFETLEEYITKLQTQREACCLPQHECLSSISNLEAKVCHPLEDIGALNERAIQAEMEVQNLKQAITMLVAEKETAVLQCNECLGTIPNLERKISQAEEESRRLKEKADKAEREVETLKQALCDLNEEKEATAFQYQHCLETISKLETEISKTQDEANMLNGEIEIGVAKLNNAKKQCLILEKSNQSLRLVVENLVQLRTQNQELLEKQQELGRILIQMQEHLPLLQADTAFQTLQYLHSQSQEEQKYLVSKLQDGLQMLTEMELQNQDLEDEIWQIKEKNKSLNELTFSSSLSKGNLHDKILSFRDRKVKLEEQVEFQVDQKNAFKKDVYGLKEEINVLNNEYQVTMEQLDSAGLKPECLVSYVTGLWDENLNLKEITHKDRDVKKALQDKLKILEKLVKKNTLLETSLSDADAELEGLRKMVKILEESFQSLLVEKSNLVAKKATLVSQLVIFTKIMGKLSKKNRFLEILLMDTNTEHEGLSAKSRKLEESWQFLDDEKSGLLIERDNQIIQLKMIWQKLEYLGKGYTKIEERCSSLEEEKESTLCQVEELRASLDAEKKEHASVVQLCETQLSCMKNQICHQKEGQWRKQEFEEELDKSVNAQIKTYILQECFKDVEEKNFSLLIDCQKNFEASKSSDKLITRMEQENLEQQIELKFLLDHIDNLRTGINQVLKAFEIEPDYECEGKTEQDQVALHYMIRRIEEMKNCVLKALDEKWQLEVEKSVLVALLEQLRLEAGDLKTERNTLHQESKMGIDQLLMLEMEKQELLEMNRKLRLEVTGRVQQEALLRDESKDLCGKLLHLQGAYMLLQSESVKMLEKNITLIKKFTDSREETCMLEQENVAILCEAIALSNLSVVFKSFGTEKAMDLKRLCEDLDCLQLAYSRLENKAGELEGKLEVEQIENSKLKESVKRLENELDLVTNASDQLNYQIIFIKDLLNQKKMELSEVEQKLKAAQGEIMDLQEKFQGLNREYDEATTTKEDRERRILKLSEDNTHKSKEIECLTELNRKLESELDRLYKENAEIKTREVSLCTELQESSETKLWETSAVAFYFDLQLFTIHESLYQEKIIEMIESFESLKDENISKNVEIEQLNERAGILEGENGRLKFQLATYFPVILSLRESIISLEQHSFLQKKPFKHDNQEPRDAEVQSPINNKSSQDPGDDQAAMVPDGVSAFQELQSRVAAVAAAVIERERLVMQESLDSNIKLEAAMKEIEELKSKSIWFQGNDAQIIRVIDMHHPEGDELGNELSDNLKLQSTEPEICEDKDGLLLKDIRLDQISECSSHGVRRMKNGVADDHLLELWETAERNHILNVLANKGPKLASAPTRDDVLYHHIPVAQEQKSSELQFEKELGVDKLVVSSKVPHQELNKKTLRRLASNAQNLENLQITVQDLKRKVEVSEKSIKGKDVEYDTAKKQLQEIEDAIVQSINVSGRLMKDIEDSTTFVDGKARKELEETENVQIRGVLEQARQGSEMIRWLQLEVQNIHFLLLKLDAEECRDKTKFAESNTILQGHFFGIGRSCPRPKKAPFCACMRPQIE